MYSGGSLAEYGDKVTDLWDDIACWSRATFGSDFERGPVGPLKHLAREVQEVLAAPSDPDEYSDCLILIFDAARRSGLTLDGLLTAALAKMDTNRQRAWPKPTSDEPVEHIREKSEHV